MQTEGLLHMTKWLADGGQFMTDIIENPYVGSIMIFTDPQLTSKQSVKSTAQGASTIVHYHTKGEFQPPAPVTSIPPAYQPEETDSETFHPSAELPLHETIELPKEMEEAYAAPVHTNPEAEKYLEPQPESQPESQPEYHPEPEIIYAPWDASRSV